MTSAALADGQRAGRWNAVLLTSALLAITFAAGLAIRPENAVARWKLGPLTNDVSTPANALRTAEAYHARHHRFRNLLAVSYKLEGHGAWSVTATMACNDRWIVSVRTLFGWKLSRAEILCDGVEVNWLDGNGRQARR